MRERQSRVFRPACERIKQIARRLRRAAHRITRRGEIAERRDHARRHVETDGIAGAAFGARIIRHQYRNAPFAPRQRAQPNQRGDAIGDHGDAIRFGPARQRGEGEAFLRRQRILERDGAGKDAAVKLRQHDMHRQIGGTEAARTVHHAARLVVALTTCRTRNAGGIERRRSIGAAAGREGRHGDDQGRIEPRERFAQEGVGRAIFQAGDE